MARVHSHLTRWTRLENYTLILDFDALKEKPMKTEWIFSKCTNNAPYSFSGAGVEIRPYTYLTGRQKVKKNYSKLF